MKSAVWCLLRGANCNYFPKSIFVSVRRQQTEVKQNYAFMSANSDESFNYIKDSMLVYNDFVDENEEKRLLEEVEPYLKRSRYEDSHWDDAIHKFRETEKSHWNSENRKIIERIKQFAFPPDVKKLNFVHILDLAEDGVIKPHIDSVRFCGRIIAGLSLSTSSVMRLVHQENEKLVVDVLLKRRSLYIMKGRARYEFKHEILSNEFSYFKGENVKKGRRVSVICRCEPEESDNQI